MRLYSILMIVVVACFCSATGCASRISKLADLAFEPGLEEWECYLAEPGAKLEDVWAAENDVLICWGNPLGYLYTKKDYRDFVLELEWQWPVDKGPGKGGVLMRMTGSHKIWPRSLEAQLNAGDAGDFWGLAGYQLSGSPERTKSINNKIYGMLTNVKKAKAMEKPAGQWNHYEIIAKGDRVILKINGQVVNEATGCDVTPGKICLTSEGNEIHFRNLRLR